MPRTGLHVVRESRVGISRRRKKKAQVISEPVKAPVGMSPEILSGHEGHKIGVDEGNIRCRTCRKVISYTKRR